MNLQGVYSKTAEGVQEITTRSLHLDAMTRRLLIIVDGGRSAEELMQFFKQGQDISVLFETLVQLELIERTGGPVSAITPNAIQPTPIKNATSSSPIVGPSSTTVISELQPTDLPALPTEDGTEKPDRVEAHRQGSHKFKQAKTFMEETARKVLGLKAVFLIARIERAADEAELFSLLDQFQSELFDGLKDRGQAKQYREKAQAMLEK